MNIHSIRKLYAHLLSDSMSLVYAGSFEDTVTTKAIKLSEHNIDKSEDLASLKKKSSYLMAECFQNVVRHNEQEKYAQYHPAEQGFFMSRSRKHMYYIACMFINVSPIMHSYACAKKHAKELGKQNNIKKVLKGATLTKLLIKIIKKYFIALDYVSM